MLETWTLAVLGLMNNTWAIWRLLRPAATRASTSHSRRVRPSCAVGGGAPATVVAAWGPRSRRARRARACTSASSSRAPSRPVTAAARRSTATAGGARAAGGGGGARRRGGVADAAGGGRAGLTEPLPGRRCRRPGGRAGRALLAGPLGKPKGVPGGQLRDADGGRADGGFAEPLEQRGGGAVVADPLAGAGGPGQLGAAGPEAQAQAIDPRGITGAGLHQR